ncbi:MAG: argininosuccinate lyase, partial [Ruoffia tabacinasalis]
ETIANKEVMYKAASTGFINATDCADYLTAKGLPFRDAYQVTGNIIQYCEETNQTLETLSLAEYKEEHALFEEDIYDAIDLTVCVKRRQVDGGPAPEKVQEHIDKIRSLLI